MTRGVNTSVENNFTRGLITEFTAMNYPENAVTETDNCVFSELGRVTRRLGLDWEVNHVQNAITNEATDTFAEYTWFSVANEGTSDFLVQQIGSNIHFFSPNDGSLSAGKKSFTVDLTLYSATGATDGIERFPCRFTSGKGFLFVVHPLCDPISIKYDANTDTISVQTITIEVRDFEGVEDQRDVDERPEDITPTHKYNLFNQGWYFANGSGTVMDTYFSSTGKYPSNADIWWLFKDSNETFTPSLSTQYTLGNTPAPKGHYIYNAFDINRETKTGITGVPSASAQTNRPSSVVFFAGRVFYSGVNSRDYANNIYFTQIVERDDQIGKCYQINDPTSETVFDLLDTDGGVIIVPQLEQIIDLRVVGDALIVMGTNGIVSIRGSDNGPFRATNYTIDLISNIGATFTSSILQIENNLVWFNHDAIYQLSRDQIGISFEVGNISKETIQQEVDSISGLNKKYIKGVYNKRDRIATWIYSDKLTEQHNNYNKILNFNAVSKAFYTQTISASGNISVRGVFSLKGGSYNTILEDVTDNNGTTLEDLAGNDVQVETQQFIANTEVVKFTTTDSNNVTFSDLNDTRFVDWYKADSTGVQYKSEFVSGYRVRGELLRDFNSTPISIAMDSVTGSSVVLRPVWDYGNRTGMGQQIYTDNLKTEYVIKKVRLRGMGKSLQLKFTSFGNNPFSIVGWSTFETGGTIP